MFNSLKFKVILFGFIFTFFSSFGQSYFLGLFNSSIRDALSITHGQFGSIYASATLCSSLLLIWVGKKIDDVNIFKFALFVIILLAFACFFFSKVSSVFLLFIAIFLMRFSGQGMMSHTASTTISRYFTRTRGRALSISWFGLSSAEFIMPVLMVYLLTIIDWQNLWLIFSITVLIILPTASFLLIKNLNLDSREASDENIKEVEIKQWSRREVIMALRNLKQIYPGIVYICVGYGDEEESIKKLVAELGLQPQVMFFKDISNELKNALVAKSNVFVMPSIVHKKSVEGFGIAYVEAAQYGLPSLGGKDGGAA
ncbi:MFS transporter, partial [Candidatus Pelagibacter sp.]|nr:MFS transporter [Candidatus Pelagibacter sp.]